MGPAAQRCREIPAFDPARNYPHWSACLAAGEFAVRYFDPSNNCMVGVDGGPIGNANDRVLVFPSRDVAEQHCLQVINDRPAVGCLIYDSDGKFAGKHVNQARLAQLAEPPSNVRLLAKGILWLGIGSVLIWWDWSRRWTIMIGILVGIRLVITGIVLLSRAAGRGRR
jgi:hypothetical protein